jgi:hypothetical protein
MSSCPVSRRWSPLTYLGEKFSNGDGNDVIYFKPSYTPLTCFTNALGRLTCSIPTTDVVRTILYVCPGENQLYIGATVRDGCSAATVTATLVAA